MARGLGIAAWTQRYDREQDPNYRRMTEEEAAAKNDRRVGDRMDGSDYERRNTENKHGVRPWHDRKEKRPNDYVKAPIHSDVHTLPEATSPEDEEPYMDVSSSALDAKFDQWRKRLRRRGYSDEEIEDILSDVMAEHD